MAAKEVLRATHIAMSLPGGLNVVEPPVRSSEYQEKGLPVGIMEKTGKKEGRGWNGKSCGRGTRPCMRRPGRWSGRMDDDTSELIQHEYDHLDGILAAMRAIDGKSFVMRG